MAGVVPVVRLVDAIITACDHGTDLFTKWRRLYRERKARRENESAELVLRSAAPEVRNEYQQDFARLGPRFATGDEFGRTSLMQQLIVLQQTVISLLERGQSTTSDTFPQLSELLRSSQSARSGSVDALAQQYQRMSQAAPLVQMPRAATSPLTTFTQCRLRQAPGSNPYSVQIIDPRDRSGDRCLILSCNSCSWQSAALPRDIRLDLRYGYNNRADVKAVLFYFYSHWPNLPEKYGCLVCSESEAFDRIGLKSHMECTPDHFWSKIDQAYRPLCGNILMAQ